MDVLVVGGGIGGMCAALGLAAQGHRVRIRVYDQSDPIAQAGSGLVLSPNGIRALDRVAPRVGELVRAEAVAEPQPFCYVAHTGRVKARTPADHMVAKWRAPLVPVRRRLLLRMLLESLPSGALTSGRRLIKVTEDGDGVVARFADRTSERAELLIGADGVWSMSRQHLDEAKRPRYLGITSVRGITLVSAHPYPGGFFSQGPGLQIFSLPLADGQLYWAATLNAAEHEWPQLFWEYARDRLAWLVRDWHPPVPQLVADTPPNRFVVTDIHDMAPLRSWSTERVALVGDAAHPMAPFLGQGANAAIEDAAALCGQLAEVGPAPAGAALASALRSYEAKRVRRAVRLFKMSRRIGMLGQWENRAAIAMRDAAMTVALRFGGDGPEAWLYGYEC